MCLKSQKGNENGNYHTTYDRKMKNIAQYTKILLEVLQNYNYATRFIQLKMRFGIPVFRNRELRRSRIAVET